MLPLGKGEILQDGKDVLILAIGRTVNDALRADASLRQHGIQATVVNCRFVKPLDHELIGDLARRIPRVITVEENVLEGGFGSAVLECLNNLEITGVTLRRIGLPDTFVEHGSQKILRSKYGIDAPAIVEAARKLSGST
jgi:1-deoxy-D-xylulose-5-phosphate synthase